MNVLSIDAMLIEAIVSELSQSDLFKAMDKQELRDIARSSSMIQYAPGEVIMYEGDKSDCFYVVAEGELIIQMTHPVRNEVIEIGRLKPFDTVGELGLLLNQPRNATIVAVNEVALLKFNESFFTEMFGKFPTFALAASRTLAQRLQHATHHTVLLTPSRDDASRADVPASAGDAVLSDAESEAANVGKSPKLDLLLRRMVADRASDLHLSAGHKPKIRMDGIIISLDDFAVLGTQEVLDLALPVMPPRNREQFAGDNDTDFAYAIPGLARFRVNLFRDNHGVGGVFRQIPSKILSAEQLGLPPVVMSICENPKGLILVTGPTGSGKSTTLAAMIDHLNRTRSSHVITMEDPIEFVHNSNKCLVNQREIGPHTKSFARALRAVLREDPDIVLVGEMRDLETVQLALETANTGHLVFGTLHTNTAISTISRVIDMFTAEQQNQVRSVLADTLKGVIAQTLCRKIGGGRVAALEILISDTGVASLIRDGKTHQVMSLMQTGRAKGNRLLNEELARLVTEKIVTAEEAMSKSTDKLDLSQKLGLTPPAK